MVPASDVLTGFSTKIIGAKVAALTASPVKAEISAQNVTNRLL